MDDLNNWLDRAFEDEDERIQLEGTPTVPEAAPDEEEQAATAAPSATTTPASTKVEEPKPVQETTPTVNYDAPAPLQSIDGIEAKVEGTMEKYGMQGNKYELRNGYIFEKPEYTRSKNEQKEGQVLGMDFSRLTTGPFGRSPSNVGFVQNAVGLYNVLTPGPDLEGPRKFKDEMAQSFANLAGNVLVGITGGSALKVSGASIASQAWLPNWLSKILNSRFVQAGGGMGATIGADVGATAGDPSSKTDHNALGSLKAGLPSWFGWIPNNLATLPTDSPDAKYRKHIMESFYIGAFSEIIPFVFRFARTKFANQLTSEIIPTNETAKKYFAKRKPVETVEEAIKTGYVKTEKTLDEVGEFNLKTKMESGVDLDKPTFGVHDVYDDYEKAVSVADDFAVANAAINHARVAKNMGTVNGRLDTILGEGGIQWATSNVQAFTKSLKGIISELRNAGTYGWKQGAQQLSADEIIKQGEELAGRIYKMDLPELKKFIEKSQYLDPSTGIPALKDVDLQAVQIAIKKNLEEIAADPVAMRAVALTQQSVAGEVSDIATASRILQDTTGEARSIDRTLDKVKYLLVQRGFTSYVRGRALNLMNIWNRVFKGDKDAASALFDAGDSPLLKALNSALQKSDEFIGTFKYLAAENPEYVRPFMTAVEYTKGDINTLDDLFDFYNRSFSTMAIAYSKDPSVSSIVSEAWWKQFYNSTLGAFLTPAKAWVETMMASYGTPITRMTGALLAKDRQAVEDAFFIFSKSMDTFQRSSKYARRFWEMSEFDPNLTTVLGRRDEVIRKSEQQWEILEQMVDAEEQLGNFGPRAHFELMRQIYDVVDDPIARLGPRGLLSADAHAAQASAEIEGWTRTLLDLREGKITEDILEQVQKVHVASMFDKKGILTDTAAKFRAQEAALNLDSEVTNGLNTIMSKFPVMKFALPFSKTQINKTLQTMASSPTLGPIGKRFKDFNESPATISPAKARQVLTKHGVPFEADDAYILDAYKNKFYEYKGRQVYAGLLTTSFGFIYLKGALTGDNTSDAAQRRWRGNANIPYRSFWTPAGWFSYEMLPYGLDNFVASVANTMDEISYGNNDNNILTSKLKSGMFILANGLTDPQLFKAMDPLFAMVDGDSSRFTTLISSTLAGMTPAGSNVFLQFSRGLNNNLKYLEDEFSSRLMSRTPFASLIPEDVSIMDGKPIKTSPNPLAHIIGTATPFGVSVDTDPRLKFLVDVMYVPRMKKTDDGIELTYDEQLAIKKWIGKQGRFAKDVEALMKEYDPNKFRAGLKENQYTPGFDKSTLGLLHIRLDNSWNREVNLALANLGIASRTRPEKMKEERKQQELRDPNLYLKEVEQNLSY